MVEFNPDWYKKLIENSSEKTSLVSVIKRLLGKKLYSSCLDIGLGLHPFFAKGLSNNFKNYTIIEKEIVEAAVPKNVKIIYADWEDVKIGEKFDIIIASHVFYYFKNKKRAIEKMLSSINDNGRVFLVVNGKGYDYAPSKIYLSKLIGEKYNFTYDKLIKILDDLNVNYKEHGTISEISAESPEELFEIIRICFDNYAKEYEENKAKMVEYFRDKVKSGKFIVEQKIVEVIK